MPDLTGGKLFRSAYLFCVTWLISAYSGLNVCKWCAASAATRARTRRSSIRHPLRSHRSPHSGLSRPTRPAKAAVPPGRSYSWLDLTGHAAGFKLPPTPEHRGEGGEFHEAAPHFRDVFGVLFLTAAPRHPVGPDWYCGADGCRGAGNSWDEYAEHVAKVWAAS